MSPERNLRCLWGRGGERRRSLAAMWGQSWGAFGVRSRYGARNGWACRSHHARTVATVGEGGMGVYRMCVWGGGVLVWMVC